MERWARLTWQAGDPAAQARLLGERLGVAPVASLRAPGAWDLWLGDELLEVAPWRREGPDDNPAGEGRLVFEPIFPGDPPAGDAGDAPVTSSAVVGQAAELVAVIWATVDLERAEAELAPWLVPLATAADDATLLEEPHLGARGRVRSTTGLPGGRLALLEPAAEGAIAASLARDGEGPCGLYVRPSPAAANTPGDARLRVRHGPFGPSVRLRTAVRAGPHVVLLPPGTMPV